MKLVITKIYRDILRQRPTAVQITIFDDSGRKQMQVDDISVKQLFRGELELNDELILIPRREVDKFTRNQS